MLIVIIIISIPPLRTLNRLFDVNHKVKIHYIIKTLIDASNSKIHHTNNHTFGNMMSDQTTT